MLSALLILTCCLSAPPEVTISTDSITLGQVIPFGGSDPRATISLGYAPNPGLARRFLKDEVLAKIIAAGVLTKELQRSHGMPGPRLSPTRHPAQVNEV